MEVIFLRPSGRLHPAKHQSVRKRALRPFLRRIQQAVDLLRVDPLHRTGNYRGELLPHLD